METNWTAVLVSWPRNAASGEWMSGEPSAGHEKLKYQSESLEKDKEAQADIEEGNPRLLKKIFKGRKRNGMAGLL